MIQKIGIIIPSYNEVANISLLTKKIFSFLPKATIVIVDDSNLQENKKLKASLRSVISLNRKRIILVSRLKKLGRGSAVITGLNEMLKNKTIRYFFEMDADLAHDPKDFQKFLSAVTANNADLVIGSRYLHESRIIKWPIWRLVLSKFINTFINIWLGLKLSDYTNGFRLYNRNAVEFLTKTQLKEGGFISLSEIAFRLKNNNFKIVEIPTSFTDRVYGKSSANCKEFVSSLIGLVRIKISPIQFKVEL